MILFKNVFSSLSVFFMSSQRRTSNFLNASSVNLVQMRLSNKLQVILSVQIFRHVYEDCFMYSVRLPLLRFCIRTLAPASAAPLACIRLTPKRTYCWIKSLFLFSLQKKGWTTEVIWNTLILSYPSRSWTCQFRCCLWRVKKLGFHQKYLNCVRKMNKGLTFLTISSTQRYIHINPNPQLYPDLFYCYQFLNGSGCIVTSLTCTTWNFSNIFVACKKN